MSEFYQRRLKNKADEDLRFIIAHPDDMHVDAIAVAKALLEEREAAGIIIPKRHYGREVMAELARERLRKDFGLYKKNFGFMTVLAAIIPAVVTLGVLHVLLVLFDTGANATWFMLTTYLFGYPLGHFFYRLFHKVNHGFWGRMTQNFMYHFIVTIVIVLEIATLNSSTTTRISIDGFWAIVLLLFFLIPFFEALLSLLNALLKFLKIHLW